MNAMTLVWLAGLIASGALVGFLVGMTGVGAGSLTTPLLITVFGLSPVTAVGTDLLFAALTKSTAAWSFQKHRYIDWTVLTWLLAGSIPGALAAVFWLGWAHPNLTALSHVIRECLGIILLLSAVVNFAYPWIVRVHSEQTGPVVLGPRRKIATVGLGLFLGTMVVMTSVGAGAIGVVALMVLFPGLTTRRLIGTDVVHAIPLTLVAGLGHLALGSIDLRVLGALLLGSIPGIAAGLRVTKLAPEWLVRRALAVAVAVAAITLLSHA